MKHTRYSVGLVLLLACLIWAGSSLATSATKTATCPATQAATQATRPATQATLPTTQATQPAVTSRPASPEDLLAQGVDAALAGRFQKAAESLGAAVKADPDHPRAAAALDLLKAYLARWGHSRKERADEYADATQRVQRALLAQRHLPKLAQDKTDKKLRKSVATFLSAYERVALGERLEDSDAEAARELRASTVKALDAARRALPPIQKVVRSDPSAYAEALKEVVAGVDKRLAAYRQAWQAAKTDSPLARAETAAKLKAMEDNLVFTIADLEMVTSSKPWRAALAEARRAKELAGEAKVYSREPWYSSALTDVEAVAKQAVADARWYDALVAYAGLEELVTGADGKKEEYYEQKAKAARRHVRVLRFYGDREDDAGTVGAQTRPEETQTTWREMSSGIDAAMVKAAVEKLNDNYVTAVDHRKALRGALLSVRILAETPQAAKAFPLLADKKCRKGFLEAVQQQLESLDNDQVGVTPLTAAAALEAVLTASEKTVQIPTRVLAMEFADGLLEELDRFSAMIWPDEVPDFRKQTMGQFFGVGIQITKKPGEPLKVVTPLPGTPAFEAGIKAGDTILAVDGRPTEDLSVDRLVRMITGKKGTKVVLTITRAGLLKPVDKSIIRDEIHIRTVKGWRRNQDGQWDHWLDPKAKVGYVRITQFTDTTAADLADVLANLKKAGIRSLILDMRFNPGGLLRAATKVADHFLAEGRIVSTKGRQIRGTKADATASGAFLEGDLAILVNEHSASAAEIVAGAIKDAAPQRGLIVGRRTFGKGSVQNVIPIRARRAYLKLTTGYYYLPSERLIHRRNGAVEWGVEPDVGVYITPLQTKRWLDLQRKTDLLKDVNQDLLQRDLVRQYDADLQLNTAVLLLRLKGLRG